MTKLKHEIDFGPAKAIKYQQIFCEYFWQMYAIRTATDNLSNISSYNIYVHFYMTSFHLVNDGALWPILY